MQLVYLMPRVEKSTWYIFKKRRCSRDTPCLDSCKYLEIKTLSFSTRLHKSFSCDRLIVLWMEVINIVMIIIIIRWVIIIIFKITINGSGGRYVHGGLNYTRERRRVGCGGRCCCGT